MNPKELIERALESGHGALNEADSKRLLGVYGIPVVDEAVCVDPDKAATRAEEIFQEADNQARDAERMVESMAQISDATRANAVAIDEVAENSERQRAVMTEVVESTDALMAHSSELRAVAHRFKTRADAKAEEAE